MLRIRRRSPVHRQAKPQSYYRWEDPQGRTRVDLGLDVVDELRAAVEAASAGDSSRGAEIGGLLLGRRGDPIRLEAFQTIDCEHRRGPSYTLSVKEKKALARRIEKTRGYEVVGYFRSHTRTGLYLDQEDFSLMQEFFGDPAQVALIVKPWAGHGQIAGFFIWEEGDIYRRASYHQFPFERSELDRSGPQPEKAVEAAEMAPRAEPPAPRTARRRRERWAGVTVAAGFLKTPHVRAAAGIAAAALGVVALGLSAVSLLPLGREKAPTARPLGNDIALSVSRSPRGVRVTWNQDSQTLAAARGATLRIDDGGQERVIALNERQIRTGSITYFPATESVTVRLDPGIQVASAPPEAPPQVEEPKPESKPVVRAARRKPAPRRFAADGLLAKHVDSADREALEPPPQLSPALLPKPAPALIPEKKMPPQALARVTYEPVRPNALLKVVNKIPGLRLLQKRQYRDAQDFHPARPVRTAAPVIPSGAPSEAPSVDLKILIDKAGEVQRAEVVSKRSSDRLEDMALAAVQGWKFAPARLENEPVESEMVVHFDFDPLASSARASNP